MHIIRLFSCLIILIHICVGLHGDPNLCYRKRGISICCRNHEHRGGRCVECPVGYISRNGGPCVTCSKGYYGKKCDEQCNCVENQICHHVYGCVDIDTTTDVQGTTSSSCETTCAVHLKAFEEDITVKDSTKHTDRVCHLKHRYNMHNMQQRIQNIVLEVNENRCQDPTQVVNGRNRCSGYYPDTYYTIDDSQYDERHTHDDVPRRIAHQPLFQSFCQNETSSYLEPYYSQCQSEVIQMKHGSMPLLINNPSSSSESEYSNGGYVIPYDIPHV